MTLSQPAWSNTLAKLTIRSVMVSEEVEDAIIVTGKSKGT